MKIWHQSFTELDKLGTYRNVMEDHFKRIVSPDTEVVLHGMRNSTYRTLYPGEDIKYAYLQFLHTTQIVRNARQAQREGYDAFFLATLPEPGLQEGRSVVDIPVVGYGQTAMLTATMLGTKFAIVCFIKELIPLYEANIRKYGLESRSAGARYLGMTFQEVVAGFPEPSLLGQMLHERVIELSREGVDVIIPGEAVLNSALLAAGIDRVDGTAVVDCLGVGIKSAEMMAVLADLSGMRHARRGYFTETPPEARMNELERFYGLLGGE